SGGRGCFYERVYFAEEDNEDGYDRDGNVQEEENTEVTLEYLSEKSKFVDQTVPLDEWKRGAFRNCLSLRYSILVTRDVVLNEEGFMRKRYLPFHDHVGFDTIAAEDDLFVPKFPVQKPDEDQHMGHAGRYNDDNDDGFNENPPSGLRNATKHPQNEQDVPDVEPEPSARHQTPPPCPSPSEPSKLQRSSRIMQRFQSPSSPTPPPAGCNTSPDPLTDMNRNPPEFIVRGSESRNLDHRKPFDSDSDDSADPLVLNVTLETAEQNEEA
ncbi:hypothetical protein HDU93_001038, partial [Gonapodya sp. JEL0774]